MLEKLYIDNYALIDKSEINFKEGFTVITGETGAGKSIMLDALSLLMGARADSKILGDKERKMVVEAVFTNPDSSFKNIFDDNSIEWNPTELIIRREISTNGRSRGFINDTPTNLSIMNTIGEGLIDIHSQHSNSLLSKPSQQLSILDSFGNLEGDLIEYKEVFHKYVALRNKIKSIKEKINRTKENKEYITFRLEQLDKLKPKKGELKNLEREAEILGDADRIKSDLEEAFNLLGGNGNSALRQLQTAASVAENIDFNLLNPGNEENLIDRLNSIKIELRDISDTFERYAEKIESDPSRFEKVQSRINVLYEMMKRFKVKDEEELVNLHEQLKDELKGISGDNSDLSKLETELKELARILKEKADNLSLKRIEVSERFSSVIEDKVFPLGLPNIKFKVDLQKGKLTSEGQDIVNFYCSFNKNHPLQPISEIASGGEISRIMLGIKSVMAETMKLPTIIFDEIDTGVSGEIAHKMGNMMKDMSKNLQVMAVTHLPQVAANGNFHLKVYKEDNMEKTISHIKLLDEKERINEIAGMLSGSRINEAALENAQILLQNNP